MYSRFQEGAGEEGGPALAAHAAANWTALAAAFREASEQDKPEPKTWSRIGELTQKVLVSEEALWSRLAEAG